MSDLTLVANSGLPSSENGPALKPPIPLGTVVGELLREELEVRAALGHEGWRLLCFNIPQWQKMNFSDLKLTA